MQGLKRKINLYGLTMIVIGSCIGSGIFITSNEVTRLLMSPAKVLLVWLIGGLVTLLGALTFAELGGLFPKSGGVYVYLKESFGKLPAFLYGWIILFIVNTGALAALSVAFAEFAGFFFVISEGQKSALAIATIIIFTSINLIGVNISQILANIFSGLKIIAIILILLIAIVLGNDNPVNFLDFSTQGLEHSTGMDIYLLAFVGVFWSFGGWHHATYLSGEVIKAQITVPRSMIIGCLAVTALYLFANVAYFLLLPIEEIAASNKVAADAIAAVFDAGGSLISILVMASLVGTIAIFTMSAPRIYFAMAQDGLFFKALTKVHPKYGTPYVSMILQSSWAIILILVWGSFVKIITFVTFMDTLFMMLAACSIFVFRKKIPKANRPYKAILYPILPAIYVLITAAFVINLVISLNKESLAGLAILLIGVFVFYYFYRKGQKNNPET